MRTNTANQFRLPSDFTDLFYNGNQAWLMVQDDRPCIGECACQGKEDTKRKKEKKGGKKMLHACVFKLLYTSPCLMEAHSAKGNRVPPFINMTKTYPD